MGHVPIRSNRDQINPNYSRVRTGEGRILPLSCSLRAIWPPTCAWADVHVALICEHWLSGRIPNQNRDYITNASLAIRTLFDGPQKENWISTPSPLTKIERLPPPAESARARCCNYCIHQRAYGIEAHEETQLADHVTGTGAAACHWGAP